MAKEREKAKAAEKKEESQVSQSYLIALIVVIIAVAIAAAYLASIARGGLTGGNISFAQFQSSFLAAPRVAIFTTDLPIAGTNNTTEQYTFECANPLIQEIIENREYHRNSSSIDYYIVTKSGCAKIGGLGVDANAINISSTQCSMDIGQEPTIFINYSTSNTTIIKANYLYTAGTASFLRECGIATEIG